MKGFLDFIREQGVVGLAVGFVLGGATASLVKSFVENIINPFLGLFGRLQNLSQASFTIGNAKFMYGDFLSSIINFIVVAAVVYFVFKWLKLDKLDKPKK